ncbi:MAG: ester cyclase [Rhizonema sp. PD38]|nr:ester cyclase [Rhizonema sp. PD38]
MVEGDKVVTCGTFTATHLGDFQGLPATGKQMMRQYQDLPMDLADASLVSAAETLNISRIFSLDSDFYIYRFQRTKAFEVIP